MTSNAISYRAVLENERHNRVMEALEGRKRSLEERNLQLQATLGYGNLAVSQGNLRESARHNRAAELETQTNNMAVNYIKMLQQRENVRSNMALEAIKAGELDLGWNNSRINEWNADLRERELSETTRRNLATEELTRSGQSVQMYVADRSAAAATAVAGINAAAQRYVTDATNQNRLMLQDAELDYKRSHDIWHYGFEYERLDDQKNRTKLEKQNAYLQTPQSRAHAWTDFMKSLSPFTSLGAAFLAP